MLAVSRAPLQNLDAFKHRMGWSFNWVSSVDSDFNYDFYVSVPANTPHSYNFKDRPGGTEREMPGISVFYKDEEQNVFHTYSCHARGLDRFNTAYHYLDIAPKGRNEKAFRYGMEWVRHHDKY